MTDIVVAAGIALLVLEIWDTGDDGSLPVLPGVTLSAPGQAAAVDDGVVLCVGPRRWWLDGAGFDPAMIASALQSGMAGRGAVTAIGGGWVKATLTGPDWRDVIMAGGLIDAEHAAFGPGTVAATRIDHAFCVIHVCGVDRCAVYLPASYTAHCLSGWEHAGCSITKAPGDG